MWRNYFIFKLTPGVVITQRFGRLDFRQDDLSVEQLQQLFEDDFPYLELTTEGRKALYGIEDIAATAVHVQNSGASDDTGLSFNETVTGSKRRVSRRKKL